MCKVARATAPLHRRDRFPLNRGKEQELHAKELALNALKDTLAKQRAITVESMGKVETVQQQQQLAVEEVERLNKELKARNGTVKELWNFNCEQLNEFDQAMLAKDESNRV